LGVGGHRVRRAVARASACRVETPISTLVFPHRLNRSACLMPHSFPLEGIRVNGGADAHVRGRPPGRPLLDAKPMAHQERDEGAPRRPGGLPHLTSAAIPVPGKLCAIWQECLRHVDYCISPTTFA
jgi:hypothetical protein